MNKRLLTKIWVLLFSAVSACCIKGGGCSSKGGFSAETDNAPVAINHLPSEPKRLMGVSESKANMVNYNLDTKTLEYEFFDECSYMQRTRNSKNDLLSPDGVEHVVKSPSFCPQTLESTMSLRSVIGHDDRTRVSKPDSWPYSCTALVESRFYGQNGEIIAERRGTGFLLGPNLLVTAAHCVFVNPSSGDDVYASGARFANEVDVYAGINNLSQKFRDYRFYAKVKTISIEKRYKNGPSQKWDWSALELDRELGERVGYYGKICNWFAKGANVVTYGYPRGVSFGMYETSGTLNGLSSGIYMTNLDSTQGQSGSPIFMRANADDMCVCGILTHDYSTTLTCGTCFNDFIYNYLDSFVTEKNNHISLKVNSAGFLKWNIRILNSGDQDLDVSYRIKMCYTEDAKYWKGYSAGDIRTIKINANGYKDVSISVNFAADAIAASYVVDNRTRFVTYANNLNSNGTLSEYHYWFDI